MKLPNFFGAHRTRTVVALIFVGIILLCGVVVYQRKTSGNVLGAGYVTTLDSEKYQKVTVNGLTHFYEPNPNEVITEHPSWLPNAVTHTINADTLNEPGDISLTKDKDVTRIVTIGDSLTFGQFVETSDNYPQQLEEMLTTSDRCHRKFEVINLGVPGYDLRYALERFKIRGNKYAPDIVLWFIKHDDVTLISELMSERITEIESRAKASGRARESESKGNYYYAYVEAMNELLEQYGQKGLIEYADSVIRDFRRNYSGKLVLFTFSSTPEPYISWLRSIDLNNVYFFDDIKSLAEEKLPDRHPNSLGYETIASGLAQYLLTHVATCSN